MNNRKSETDRSRKDKNWMIWTENRLGAEGARMISESLKTNTTLTTLDLNSDEIEVNENNE